jgi:hypothetical protein
VGHGVQPLDTASTRMQTSAFGKSKGLWATLTEGSWREAYAGFGASLVLVSNPAIQVWNLANFTCMLFYCTTETFLLIDCSFCMSLKLLGE